MSGLDDKDSRANGDIKNLGANDGDRAPYFPRHIASLNGRYTPRLGERELVFEGDWTFRGDALTRLARNDPTVRKFPASDFLSLSAIYHRDNWEIGLFVQNLTNNTDILPRGPDTYAPFQPGDTVT